MSNPSESSTHSPSSTGTCEANVVADSEEQEGAARADVPEASGASDTQSINTRTAATFLECICYPSFPTLSMMRQIVLNPTIVGSLEDSDNAFIIDSNSVTIIG